MLSASYAAAVRFAPAASRLTVDDLLGVAAAFSHNGKAATTAGIDTLRVAALRVQFVPDSLKTTTGNGRFDLSEGGDAVIDRPPHNKTYFEHQLLALRNYFRTVSNGRLIIEYRVWPDDLNDAYDLPHDMVYYSGEEDEQRRKLRWAELLRDAVSIAWQRDAVPFDRFDTVIVFHAGVGKDFAFDFTETPFDIQSVFLDWETVREMLGGGDAFYGGIEAGGARIREGIILPESQSQKGYELGLLGTAVFLTGSRLGMPNLFDTRTGRPGIGKWGMMDQGSYNSYGLIPAHPSAWEKVYMGWEEAIEVSTLEEAVIGCFGTRSAPRILKVPITEDEYFLLENRQQDPNHDGITYGRDENGRRVKFDSTGTLKAEEGLGVITRIDEYDYGLPGSGILIWHIDERVIRQNLLSNTVNNDPSHRGVKLIECDGPQDIGQIYSMFTAGYGTEAGDYWDPYWDGNLSHQYVNGGKPVEFSSRSIPNSNAYGGAVTNIRINNFSRKDTLMTLSIGSDFQRRGFPQAAGSSEEGGITPFRAPDGRPALALVARDGSLFAWNGDGSRVLPNEERLTTNRLDFHKSLVEYPLALIGRVGAKVRRPLAAWDFFPELPGEELLTIDERGELLIWSAADADHDGYADVAARFEIGERPTAGPLVLEPPLGGAFAAVGTESGKVFLLTLDNGTIRATEKYINNQPVTAMIPFKGGFAFVCGGNYLSMQSFAAGELRETHALTLPGKGGAAYLLRLEAEQGERLVVTDAPGNFWLIDQRGEVTAERFSYSTNYGAAAPAFGDADGDGDGEIIFVHEQKLHVLEMNGVPSLNFPAAAGIESAHISPAPLHVQGEAGPLTLFSKGNFLYALDGKGKIIDGFPLVASGNRISALSLWVNDDQTLTIFAESNGFLHAWDTGIKVKAEGIWPCYGGDSRRSFSVRPALRETTPQPQAMPEELVFCYPNPASEGRTYIRYTLRKAVAEVDIRIYDIAGSPVARFGNNPVHEGDHEVMWDVSSVQSGAYLARVEARGDGGSTVKFLKIAVVK